MDVFTPGDIGRLFSPLAPRYRRFNRWASLGQDNRWRRSLIAEIEGRRRVLDVGTGTGELAALAAARGASAVGLDVSPGMLEEARRRWPSGAWVLGDGKTFPFPAGAFDAVVSAYVLRNLLKGGVLPGVLREARRVLSPDGRLVFLDLTRPEGGFQRWGHGLYNRTILPALGRWFFGEHWPGDYLADSIDALPPADELRTIFQTCGFRSLTVRPLWGGVVSLFIGSDV
ncbi:MAG TPA: class I SAM-dependent methyltransferase [Elusimicrobiota bacterium]|nr:class I SAM-dependent methyltransferase [Elusimicrobiota bacterium]